MLIVMRLLDELQEEHVRIERVLGSLRTYSARVAGGEATLGDRDRFVFFFTVYAGRLHHEKEEKILFPALAREAELPLDRGPLAVILGDHERMGGILERIASCSDPVEFDALALRYSHELWQHIDIENSVLFPESEAQLKRAGVSELPLAGLSAEESEAAKAGDELIALYPPIVPDSFRGDGCVMCHAFGDGCRGLEREWWNEWMWEEFDEHIAAS